MKNISYSPVPEKDYWSTASAAVSCCAHILYPGFFTLEDIEDITSLVVEKLWSNRSAYDPGKGSFATWTGTIARNTVRSVARTKSIRILPADYTYYPCDGYADEPDAELIAEQTQQELLRRLHTDRDRRMFRWTVLGLNSGEIAEQEGIPVNVAYTALSRMRTKLRNAA